MTATPHSDADARSDVKATWVVSLLTLVSRILGFLRLVLLVQLFSQLRWASDAFIFAFRIPNLFRNLLGEGALSAAFIPTFVRTHKNDGAVSSGILASQIFTLLSLIGTAIAGLGILVCLGIDALTDNAEASLAFRLTALLFPFMPLICLAALLGGMLNSVKRFTLPAAMSILLNLGFLAAFAYVYWWQCGGDTARLEAAASTQAIAVFILAAGLLEVVVLLPALAVHGILVRPAFSFNHPGVKETLTAFLPVAVGLGLVQVNAFVDSLIAGYLTLDSAGAVTYLEIAFRFVQLPLGVFGVAIATVSFPAFAATASAGDHEEFFRRLVRAVRMSLFLILPCAAVLIAMADPIIRLACQRADLDFSHAAVYRAELCLVLYSCGLAFYSLRQILVRAFYAQGDYRFPVKVAAAMVAVNLVLNLTLIHVPDLFRQNFPSYYHYWNLSDASFPGGIRLGEAGLSLATCLTAVLDTAILALALRKRLTPSLPSAFRAEQFTLLWQTAARMAVAAIALGVLTWFFRNSIPYDPRFWPMASRVAVSCLLAGGAFYLLGIIIPLPEMKEFATSLLRRR